MESILTTEAVFFQQQGYRCKLEWGRQGARVAAARGDVLVIVDVIRFSTTVATAIHHGAVIYPCLETDDAETLAEQLGAEVAVKKREEGRFTLSPSTFEGITPGARVVLSSLNGATCSRYAGDVPYLFVGALVNAQAVGNAVRTVLLENPHRSVTVVACGERWQHPNEDGELRHAIEDYLGAGAILARIPFSKSPEARVCETAFLHSQEELTDILLQCGSGLELIARNQRADVLHAAQRDIYSVVPIMKNGWLVDVYA